MIENRVVILGASYLQNPLIELALSKGLEVFVISSEESPEISRDCKYYKCDLREFEKLSDLCWTLKPQAVCSIASDITALASAYVNTQLKLVSESFSKIEMICNKARCKEYLRMADYRDIAAQLSIEAAHIYLQQGNTAVIKPVDRSGSRGVAIVSTMRELQAAIDVASSSSFSGEFIIEEYLEGKEYSVESLSVDGRHFIVAITEKFLIPGTVVELSHVQGRSLDKDLLERIRSFTIHLLSTLKLENCPGHTELKVSKNGIKLIEIGPRVGGDLIGSHLVPLSTGIDFCGSVLDMHLGRFQSSNLEQRLTDRHVAGITFDFNSSQIAKLSQPKGIEIVAKKAFVSSTRQLASSADRLGYTVWKSRDLKIDCSNTDLWF